MFEPIILTTPFASGVILDERCATCDGCGAIANVRRTDEYECPTCAGRGSIPTPQGLAILALVRRYAPQLSPADVRGRGGWPLDV